MEIGRRESFDDPSSGEKIGQGGERFKVVLLSGRGLLNMHDYFTFLRGAKSRVWWDGCDNEYAIEDSKEFFENSKWEEY